MIDERIDSFVKQIALNLQGNEQKNQTEQKPVSQLPKAEVKTENVFEKKVVKSKTGVTLADYPLAQKKADELKGSTGKSLKDITIETVMNEQVSAEDVRISGDVLRMQADIAEANGKVQFAEGLRRSAEMTIIPDERVLEMYNMLRPNRATKQELLDMADELENKYSAKLTAEFVRDAIVVYEKRNILLA